MIPRTSFFCLAAIVGSCRGSDELPTPDRDGYAVMEVRLEGIEAALSDRLGAPLLLNFWATWCPPCVDELPDLVRATRSFRDGGGAVHGVALELMAPNRTLGEARASVPEVAKACGVDYPVLLFVDLDPGPVLRRFALPGDLPCTVLIDAAGREVARHEGRATVEEIAALLSRLPR